ncbi:MAG: LolA-like putative outer membrane lipoprotein chaperone [bacterium]
MKKTVIAFFMLLLFLPVIATAQNDAEAERVVKSSLRQLKRNAYSGDFSMVFYSAQTETADEQRGNCLIDGERYSYTIGDFEAIFDGKTQWVFMAADNEVSITEPTVEELRATNPMSMIDYYLETRRIKLDPNQLDNATVINFFAEKEDVKSLDIFKVTLVVDDATKLPTSIKIYERSGNIITFLWNRMKKVTPADDAFTFQTAKYPNVYVNDLR